VESHVCTEQRTEVPSLVSAITIFLNGEKFIQEAIESVLAQTYERWELWLVDDGSTDGSGAIALDFVERYPTKIHYLEHEGHCNRGMSASRNLALRHARGEYIAFLDADDVWLPHMLEQQHEIAAGHPEAGLVFGRTLNWYSWTNEPADRARDVLKYDRPPGETLYEPPELLIRLLQDPGIIPGNCSMLVRSDVAKRVNGFEDQFTGIFEDQVFFAKICLATPIYVSSACVARYRQHRGSCCRVAWQGASIPDEPNRPEQAFLDWLEAYLRNSQTSDQQVWRELQKRLRPYRQPLRYAVERSAKAARRRATHAAMAATRRILPATIYTWLGTCVVGKDYPPRVGGVRFGSLRRLTPICRNFGYDRGTPIDRYYIEAFLGRETQTIAGRVLEIGDPTYTRRFGGTRVTASDVLHVRAGNPAATLVGDLVDAPHLPSASFDCVILTQTLQFIFDLRAALETVHRILKPGGTVLATLPGISHIGDPTWGSSWHWNITPLAARRLFGDVFGAEQVVVAAFGNVLVATAFLQGLAAEELNAAELCYADPDYPMLVTVRATKR
jgi:glycosyltransferase involved in cell wall biosynthesis